MSINRYSLSIFLVAITLIVTGAKNLRAGNLMWLIPFTIGVAMFRGLRGPASTEESPIEKVWLMTFLGKHTETIARRLTLILDWPLNIVGYVEIEVKMIDHDFQLKKPIYCKRDKAYLQGFVSTSMVPDDQDDPSGTPNWKSGAEKLQDFLNIEGFEGAKVQLDDILTSWIEEMANTADPERDIVWMETHGVDISTELLRKITTGKFSLPTNGNHDIDDTTGFGLKFKKLQVILRPTDKVIDSRNDGLVEVAQRRADLLDEETFRIQLTNRMAFYQKGEKDEMGAWIVKPDSSRTLQQVRDELFEEKLLKAGKYQRLSNPQGINVANVNAPVNNQPAGTI